MSLFRILQLCTILVFIACKNDVKPTDVATSNSGDTVTPPESSEILADNEPDRVIWQKPELVLTRFGNLEGKTVVDIGAGSGFFTFRLLSKGSRVIAVDIDTMALNNMKRFSSKLDTSITNRLRIVVASEDDPMIAPDKADAVLLSNTYLFLNDRVTYLRTLQQYLTRDAIIMIIDYKKKNLPFGPPTHIKLDLSQVENELTSAGFDIISSDDQTLDYQYIVLAKWHGDAK